MLERFRTRRVKFQTHSIPKLLNINGSSTPTGSQCIVTIASIINATEVVRDDYGQWILKAAVVCYTIWKMYQQYYHHKSCESRGSKQLKVNEVEFDFLIKTLKISNGFTRLENIPRPSPPLRTVILYLNPVPSIQCTGPQTDFLHAWLSIIGNFISGISILLLLDFENIHRYRR